MVGQIYPTKFQLNKVNSPDTVAPFLDLDLSIMNFIVSSKIYDKQDDFNFEIVKPYFLTEMFFAPFPMGYIFCNLFVLQECVLMFFCGSFLLFMSCVCHAFTSVYCFLAVTCWERADLLAPVCDT